MSTTFDPQRDLVPAGRAPSVHDGLAVTSFVLAFFLPLIGFILGWVSIAAAHRDGRRASGLAVAGMVIGGLATVVIVIAVIAVASAAGSSTDQMNAYLNCLNTQLTTNPALVCTPPAGA